MGKVKTSPWCWKHPVHTGCPPWCYEVDEGINPMFDLHKEIKVVTKNSAQGSTASGVINS